ncbi:hypothetical protein AB0M64_34740, partial [Streptomyces sp. NPDC051771]|uniref:hypothetical protein n=1 Tax=Streptomyces sp. NPDC051771 TaxID=3154847 RepID=UPI00342C984C
MRSAGGAAHDGVVRCAGGRGAARGRGVRWGCGHASPSREASYDFCVRRLPVGLPRTPLGSAATGRGDATLGCSWADPISALVIAAIAV